MQVLYHLNKMLQIEWGLEKKVYLKRLVAIKGQRIFPVGKLSFKRIA